MLRRDAGEAFGIGLVAKRAGGLGGGGFDEALRTGPVASVIVCPVFIQCSVGAGVISLGPMGSGSIS